MLTSILVLSSPNFEKTLILQTDASNYGVGAVLSQEDEEGMDRPIACFSWRLLGRVQKYSTIEKECLFTVPLIYNFTFTRVYTQGDTTQVL